MYNVYFKYFLFFILIASAGSVQISLQGFIPPRVSEADFIVEYKKICSLLDPYGRIDPSPIDIVFFSDKGMSTKQYSLPEWGGGGAIGLHTIVVRIDKKPFLNQDTYQTAVHELVHIALNRITTIPLPRWFHEGIAMTLSGETSTEESIIISKAIFTGSLIALHDIDSVNNFGQFKAELSYCQSRQAILYLVDTYGMDVLAEIISEVKNKRDFWDGLYEVLHISEKEFEFFYRNYLLDHHGKFFWLIDTYIIWSSIVFLFIIGFILTIYRRKRKMILLETEYENENESAPDDTENSKS